MNLGAESVASVFLVDEFSTASVRLPSGSVFLVSVESSEAVALVQRSDGVSHVVQFFNHSVLDLAQTDNQTEDEDRGNENQFSGDDETGFIIEELTNHCESSQILCDGFCNVLVHGPRQGLILPARCNESVTLLHDGGQVRTESSLSCLPCLAVLQSHRITTRWPFLFRLRGAFDETDIKQQVCRSQNA